MKNTSDWTLFEEMNFLNCLPKVARNLIKIAHYFSQTNKKNKIDADSQFSIHNKCFTFHPYHFSVNSSLVILQMIRSFGNIITIIAGILLYFVNHLLQPFKMKK